jgi:hypothetical protein
MLDRDSCSGENLAKSAEICSCIHAGGFWWNIAWTKGARSLYLLQPGKFCLWTDAGREKKKTIL